MKAETMARLGRTDMAPLVEALIWAAAVVALPEALAADPLAEEEEEEEEAELVPFKTLVHS